MKKLISTVAALAVLGVALPTYAQAPAAGDQKTETKTDKKEAKKAKKGHKAKKSAKKDEKKDGEAAPAK